ncbi:MAG: protein kinase domain-containing protein [Vicinamibacteria bacterium]
MANSGATNPKTGRYAVAAAVGSRYHIQSKVGAGAFADVYEAHDAILNRTVAIKQFRLDSFAYPNKMDELRRRILHEAQVAAKLHHSNIVTTHDVILTEERCVIVMEFAEGETLEALLQKHGPLGLADTVRILTRVADALAYAHEQRVVHRDIKPANIMVAPSGQVKVTDFGIAKAESSAHLTASGTVLGTPDYMSPEQARGQEVDGRSDLFSLGCILYECLSGRKPFAGETMTEVLLKIVNEKPPLIDCETLGLPAAVHALLQNALAKDPVKRFVSGAEFAKALRALPAGESASSSSIFAREDAANSREQAPTDLTTPRAFDSVADSLMREARRTVHIEPHLDVLLRDNRKLRLVSSPLLRFHNVLLTPEEAFILSRIDGTVTPREVFQVSALSDKDTARTLLGLLRAGIIELDGEPAPRTNDDVTEKDAQGMPLQRIEHLFELFQHQNDWQVLGIERGANLEEIKRAFQQKTFEFHPERHAGLTDPDARRKLSFLFTRVSEAFATLSNGGSCPEAERKTDSSEDPAQEAEDRRMYADALFARAKKAFEEKDHLRAVLLCREAIELADDRANYFHLLGLALSQNRKSRLEAEQNLQRAAKLDPRNPEYLSALGTLYENEGLRWRARTMFENAHAAVGSYSMADNDLASFLFQDRSFARAARLSVTG